MSAPDSALATALRFVALVNAHDVDNLAALMTSDHQFIDSLGSVTAGAEHARDSWAAYFRIVPDYALEITGTMAQRSAVILHGMARGSFAPQGGLLPGSAWSTPVALRAIIRDGRLAEWQVYADNEPIREQMRRVSG